MDSELILPKTLEEAILMFSDKMYGNDLLDTSKPRGYNKNRSWISEIAHVTSTSSDPNSRKVFVMLKAYMDDSGSHEGSHNCVIGGYWGTVDEWQQFEREWQPMLASEGVDEFHSADLWNGHGSFEGWSRERVQGFADKALKVIEGREIYPFISVVFGDDWNKLSDAEKVAYTGCESPTIRGPQFIALHHIVMRLPSYCQSESRIHFVMDRDNKIGPSLLATFSEVTNFMAVNAPELYLRIGALIFDDSKKALPLQAADLLAYEAHGYARKFGKDPAYEGRDEYIRALDRKLDNRDFFSFDPVDHIK